MKIQRYLKSFCSKASTMKGVSIVGSNTILITD